MHENEFILLSELLIQLFHAFIHTLCFLFFKYDSKSLNTKHLIPYLLSFDNIWFLTYLISITR